MRANKELYDAAIAELRLRAAKINLACFILETLPNYKMGWVHEEICNELDSFLEQVIAKKSPRLIITMPPRHGKSEIASRRFPAYALGRYPDLSFIATSYSADLASRMNRDVQRIIDSQEYKRIFPNTLLGGKSIRSNGQGSYLRNSDIFEIVDHKGTYRSAGVGGGITGMGGDIILIDDPIKDRAEADSATIRNKVWDWYTSTLYTRLAPGGGLIVIQTRWHMDDLTGRLLNPNSENWRVVNFPAIAEHDEKYRKTGEALHPERYDLAALNRIKKAVGSRDWAALYQQRPVPAEGAVFKQEWIKYYTQASLPPVFNTILISWDMTFKDSAASDFVVGQVWGKNGANFYLLDSVRGRWDFVKTLEMFQVLANKWPKALKKLVEDKANGTAIIQTLKKSISGIKAITPKESKEARAYSITPLWEAGNVFIPDPKTAAWVKDFEAEILSFPSAAHDDQVDAMTQALAELKTSTLKIHPTNLQYLRLR